MKKAFTLLALSLAGVQIADAQTSAASRCGVDIVRESYFARYPDARSRYEASRTAILEDATNNAQAKTTANGPIPVVFHIVLTTQQLAGIGGTAGVAERVDSSIAVLNRDFNRRNADSSRIPAVFKSLYGNADIQFGLARRNEQGLATPGYEILTTSTSGFEVDFDASTPGSGQACAGAKYSSGQGGEGLNAWDPSKYFNIWICNTESSFGEVLGIAIGPGFGSQFNIPAVEYGVVLDYLAFGKKRLPSQAFISGIDSSRTLTHETGHFFELNHIWGDDGNACPGQSGYSDDGIGDTPIQDKENTGCPSGVLPNCTGSAGGEMYMNYMDYCDDRCLVMFTTQQCNLMRAQVQGSGPSVTLTQNPILVTPLAVNDVKAMTGLALSPNPARNYATLTHNASQKLKSAILMDATGRAIRTFAPASTTGVISLDLHGIAAGIYTLRAEFEAGAAAQKIVVQP